MKEYQADIPTPDGNMDTFIAHPDAGGPFHAVILYMDVPGIREELRDFTRHIAAQGFMGVLPDLYYREGKVRFDLAKGEEELKRMFAMGQKLTNEMIVRDTQGIIDWLSAAGDATGPHGCIGYCMSGQFVVSVAGRFPDDIAAAASLYGVNIVTDKEDSPHLLANKIKGELYLGFASEDPYVPDNVIPDLEAALDANGVTYTTEIHPGTEHGFCFPQRPAYNREAAEKVWDTVFGLYNRALKS